EQAEAWLYDISTKALTRMTNASGTGRTSWSDDINSAGTKITIGSDSDFLNEGIVADQYEIWLYDTTVPTLTRITHASDPNRQSFSSDMNSDGTLVAFYSDSDFNGQGIVDEQYEIWLYDTTTLEYTRVTTASDTTRGSYAPKLSDDGTKIFFLSDSDFDGEGIPLYQFESWFYDVSSGELERITTAANGEGDCSYFDINADGSRVVFQSNSDYFNEGIPLSQDELWLYDVLSDELSRITTASDLQRVSQEPSLSADGSMVAFHSDSDFKSQGVLSHQYEIWLFELPSPSPRLSKMVNAQYPAPGQTITFTITVFNPLLNDLTDVEITDTLPKELEFVGPVILDPYQPDAILAADSGDLPVLAAGVEITAGETVTLTFPVMVDERVKWGTTITNTASVVSNETPDPSSGSVAFDVVFRVTSVDPEQNCIHIPSDTNLTIELNDVFDKNSINEKTIVMHGGCHGQIGGSFSSGSIIFNPTAVLFPGEIVQTSVTAGVETSGGDPLTPFVWEFRAAAGPGPAVFSPHPVKHYLPTFQTTETGLGDLDGDGDLDVILASSQFESVWMNDGTGVLTAHSTTPTFGDGRGRAISLGDMDQDGDLDAVVTNNVTDTIWLNDGDGNMTPHLFTPEFDTGEGYDNVLGDIDGDGDLDVIVARNDDGNAVWVNDGKGNLSQHSTPAFGPGDSFDIEIGDVDNDGDLDVLVAYTDLQSNTVWENDGLGNFKILNAFGTAFCNGLAVGDLDGDGDLDAVAVYNGDTASVWLNGGSGIFSPHPITPTFGDGGNEVTLGDIDGDGDLDAVLPRFNQLSQTVWLNDGAGNFTPSHFDEFGAGYTMQVALGDLDGDGDLDAVLTDNSNLDTSIWLNHQYNVMLPLVLKGQ
ncbi:MAG: VCBS repeat-containing protein, partial [Anaerolineales bacterium]|nr:VCBS repeat-containing protein [Anaerolineales bacterium]